MRHAVIIAAVVLVAGCSGTPVGAPDSGPEDPPTGPTDATPSTTPTPSTPERTARFEVQAFQAPPVRITMTTLGNGTVVADETHNGTFAVEFDAATALEPGRDYRAVVRVDGDIRWNRTVASHESYTLRVGDDGNVTVLSHATA